MRTEQTSPTTFELQSDSGCHALAGLAVNTMGAPGVYWHRDPLTKTEAEQAFLSDLRVREAIRNLTTKHTKDTKQS